MQKNHQANYMASFTDILNQKEFSKNDLMCLLSAQGIDKNLLFEKSGEVLKQNIGNKVHLRGLIEYSNYCIKDCLYCGIRKSNSNQKRFVVNDAEVIKSAVEALENNYGSIVIQSGERTDKAFIDKITDLLKKIKSLSNGKLGITLSFGEQTLDTYKKWFDAGGHRYLLRIESSNRNLYKKIHPNNNLHQFDKRLEALYNIRKAGFQLGTGFMIGLPFQTIEDLANDLLFLKDIDIDMVGMGPYIEHEDTPLYQYRHLLISKKERLELALKMIAALRLLMPDINIASTTALQALSDDGRERALQCGANILMPNITLGSYSDNYNLYEGKPDSAKNIKEDCIGTINLNMININKIIAYNEWGDSKHFKNRKSILNYDKN